MSKEKEATKKAKVEGEYSFDKYEADSLSLPRNEAWDNFKSWKDDKPGEKVQGYIRDAFYLPEEKGEDGAVEFKAQRGITIETPDGELMNVAIKYLSFVLKETDHLRVGDPLTVKFEKEGVKKKKSWSSPKIFGFYGVNLKSTEGNKTVKELTDIDLAAGGSRPMEKTPEGAEPEGETVEDDEDL